jgi:hypothetical protein
MAYLEYILLALLGSTGVAAPAATPGDSSTSALNADAITQPNGAVSEYSQKKPLKTNVTQKGRENVAPPAPRRHSTRRKRRHHQHIKGSSTS